MLLGHYAPVLIRYNLFRGALLLAVEILTGVLTLDSFPRLSGPASLLQGSARTEP